jgi:hypothetical protein
MEFDVLPSHFGIEAKNEPLEANETDFQFVGVHLYERYCVSLTSTTFSAKKGFRSSYQGVWVYETGH